MRQYYVHFYNNELPNAYRLYYTDHPAERIFLPEGTRRATRKDAEKLAREERYRQRHARPNSGNADNAVFPASYDRDRSEMAQDDRYILENMIWIRRQ